MNVFHSYHHSLTFYGSGVPNGFRDVGFLPTEFMLTPHVLRIVVQVNALELPHPLIFVVIDKQEHAPYKKPLLLKVLMAIDGVDGTCLP